MDTTLVKGAGLIAALLLSGCAPGSGMMATAASTNASGIMTTALMITADPASSPPRASNIVLASRVELRKALEGYGVPTSGPLGARIAQIRTANMASGGQVPGLTGFGGIYGHAFLDMAEDAIANGQFAQGSRVVTSIHGQITDYGFDRTTGFGSLEAITYFTRTVVPAGLGAPPPKTEAYKYKITVQNLGFSVVVRDDAATDGPFPGTLPFSQEMKDRVDSLGFTRKLWAKGPEIVVDRVWHKGIGSSTFNEVFPTQPKYARLFQTDSKSCIDMLFVGERPATFAELEGPPTYCLGRCDDPFIVNTGV